MVLITPTTEKTDALNVQNMDELALLKLAFPGLPVTLLVARLGGLRQLYHATIDEMCRTEGITPALAQQIKALCDVGLRMAAVPAGRQITTWHHVLEHIPPRVQMAEQEELWVIVMDTKNRVLHSAMVYRGTINTVGIRPAEIFRQALRFNGAGIILVHNHPSQDPTPSVEDRQMTKTLVKLGDDLGIQVHDHIVIGGNEYVSMRELYALWEG